ncbi:LCP family protein [bacterium]|nr:LCP family protein [bacterium]
MKNHRSIQREPISPGKLVSYLISFIMLIVIIVLILLSLRTCSPKKDLIYAGIGGCVQDPGVYPITSRASLFDLVMSAKGAKQNADFSKLDLDSEVQAWEVYCIPCKQPVELDIPVQAPEIQVDIPEMPKLDKLEEINIIYAGLPRTFILITIYPKQELLFASHLPWFTAIPDAINGTKTLYETYLYGGTSDLVSGVQMITNKKIDYYFCQDRPSWIKFIDYLGGVKVDIPDSFAKQYRVNSGPHVIDGYTSWLYITYISKDMRKIDFQTGSLNRMSRQKAFMLELYKKFINHDFFVSTNMGKQILDEAETNFTVQNAVPIAIKVKGMKNRKIEYFTFPGIHKTINGKVYWETKLQEYQQKVLELNPNNAVDL